MDDYGLEKPTPRTNQTGKHVVCRTCDGDRFVTVRLRSAEQTLWQAERNLVPSRNSFHEEVAPCPDCHQIEVSWWRHDGTRFRGMDPAAVRAALAT